MHVIYLKYNWDMTGTAKYSANSNKLWNIPDKRLSKWFQDPDNCEILMLDISWLIKNKAYWYFLYNSTSLSISYRTFGRENFWILCYFLNLEKDRYWSPNLNILTIWLIHYGLNYYYLAKYYIHNSNSSMIGWGLTCSWLIFLSMWSFWFYHW